MMTINEYITHLKTSDDRFRKSRLLIVPGRQDRLQVGKFYNQDPNASTIRLSDSIETNAFMPMPSRILFRIKEHIRVANETGGMACVIGLDGYIQLLDPNKISELYGGIREILDDANMHAVFLLSSFDAKRDGRSLAYPRYKEEKTIIRIGNGIEEPAFTGSIVLALKKFLPFDHLVKASITDFLSSVEDETLHEGQVCVFVESECEAISGFNQSIKQLLTLRSYMREVWHFEDEMSDDAIQWLYSILHQSGREGSALAILQQWFYPENIQDCTVTAPKKIREAASEEKEALVWMLKKTVPSDSYLYSVLFHKELSLSGFVLYYVCTAADLLGSPHAAILSEERKKALKEIGHENIVSALNSFVNQCSERSTKQVAIWLNNGTTIEKIEILRRVISDQGVEIPKEARNSYPLLDTYLGSYELGYDSLDDYFTQYRIQKLKNDVTEEFCYRAASEKIPKDVPSRDEIISSYVTDEKVGLLVVDALGVEYVPMILALAQKLNINVVSMVVGQSRLPTTTACNPIAWPETRKLQEVKHLDNIVHGGEEKHVTKPTEVNLMAVLEVMEKNVLPAIEEGLSKYDQVILTSDHGASRLAVCAYDKNFAKTIEQPGQAKNLDWRFSTAPEVGKCPDTMEPSFCGKYWVVKGYNRLSKQGGKYHELHGGATLEERLVPVLIFGKGAIFTPKSQLDSVTKGEQLIVKDDFDL